MRTVLRLGLPWMREGQVENNGVAGHLATAVSKCLEGNRNMDSFLSFLRLFLFLMKQWINLLTCSYWGLSKCLGLYYKFCKTPKKKYKSWTLPSLSSWLKKKKTGTGTKRNDKKPRWSDLQEACAFEKAVFYRDAVSSFMKNVQSM